MTQELVVGDRSTVASTITLSGLHRYPVKSCRGQALTSAVVERWGLAGDRRWMVVDPTGKVVTARECARLVLVVPSITNDGLLLTGPDLDPLHVSEPNDGALVEVSVWDDRFLARLAAEEGSQWFSRLTGRTVRLVYFDDPRRRPTDSARSRPGDVVALADGYPLLLATEESLAALNGWIADGPRAADGPLPMTRFRPNLVVAGAPAWAEDRWRRLRIGEATFRAVKACDRCALTMIDPETAKKTKEPLLSLARYRRWNKKTWFAVNLIPDDPDAPLHVGDRVDVLVQVDTPEPQR